MEQLGYVGALAKEPLVTTHLEKKSLWPTLLEQDRIWSHQPMQNAV